MNNTLKWFKVLIYYGVQWCVNSVLENYKNKMSFLLLCGRLLWHLKIPGSLPEDDQYLKLLFLRNL